MPGLTKCPECGSPDLIPNQSVMALSAGGAGELAIEVQANPDALLMKGRQIGMVRATVCGACGYVRLGVYNPQDLLAAYRKQTKTETA
jgi:hypothetical protein